MVSEGLLNGHTVLVTGASKGIGLAISIGFAEQGADLLLVARKKANMAEVHCCPHRIACSMPGSSGTPARVCLSS